MCGVECLQVEQASVFFASLSRDISRYSCKGLWRVSQNADGDVAGTAQETAHPASSVAMIYSKLPVATKTAGDTTNGADSALCGEQIRPLRRGNSVLPDEVTGLGSIGNSFLLFRRQALIGSSPIFASSLPVLFGPLVLPFPVSFPVVFLPHDGVCGMAHLAHLTRPTA